MSDCPHGRCDGSGFIYDEATRRATDCSCRPTRIARRKAASLAGQIPRRYRSSSFEQLVNGSDIDPDAVREARRYAHDIAPNLEAGRGISFVGDVGTGKTTLAMLISKHALSLGHSVAIYSLPRLLGLLRESFDDGAETSLGDLIDRLTAVELLHIDDVGAEKTSPWVIEQLYSIVNARYEEERAVMFTTNLDRDQLIEQIGHRTVSRLDEICSLPIQMFGRDRRQDYRPPPGAAAVGARAASGAPGFGGFGGAAIGAGPAGSFGHGAGRAMQALDTPRPAPAPPMGPGGTSESLRGPRRGGLRPVGDDPGDAFRWDAESAGNGPAPARLPGRSIDPGTAEPPDDGNPYGFD